MPRLQLTLLDLSDKKDLFAWIGWKEDKERKLEERWQDYRQQLLESWLSDSSNPNRPISNEQFFQRCRREEQEYQRQQKKKQKRYSWQELPSWRSGEYLDWLAKVQRAVCCRVSKPGGLPQTFINSWKGVTSKVFIQECKRRDAEDRRLLASLNLSQKPLLAPKGLTAEAVV